MWSPLPPAPAHGSVASCKFCLLYTVVHISTLTVVVAVTNGLTASLCLVLGIMCVFFLAVPDFFVLWSVLVFVDMK